MTFGSISSVSLITLFVISEARSSARMSSAGFEVIHNDRHDYDWSFPDTSTMFEFCTGLFGLDQASPAALTKGLSNLRSENTPHIINWGLLMIMESKTKLANEGEVK